MRWVLCIVSSQKVAIALRPDTGSWPGGITRPSSV
jgi:hypothetical protein